MAREIVDSMPVPKTRKAEPTRGKFGSDRGTPVHYDPRHEGPIISEMRPSAGWADEALETWAHPVTCSMCEKFHTKIKAKWREHSDTVHDGRALFHRFDPAAGPAVKCLNTARKPTKSADIDPHGRTIYGTPEQLRMEADRHDREIIKGPGAR